MAIAGLVVGFGRDVGVVCDCQGTRPHRNSSALMYLYHGPLIYEGDWDEPTTTAVITSKELGDIHCEVGESSGAWRCTLEVFLAMALCNDGAAPVPFIVCATMPFPETLDCTT